jgi:hypothetical protein
MVLIKYAHYRVNPRAFFINRAKTFDYQLKLKEFLKSLTTAEVFGQA